MNEEATTRGTTCPRCGKVVDPDARFCKYCAFDLAQSEQCSQTTTAQQSFCPHCGGEVGDNAVFCGSCGGTLPAGHERAPAKVQKSRLGATLIACFAIGGIVVFCLLLLLFGSRKSPQIVVAQSSNSSEQSVSSTSTSSRTTQTDSNQLTNAKVEDAVGSMVSNLQVGGVSGLRVFRNCLKKCRHGGHSIRWFSIQGRHGRDTCHQRQATTQRARHKVTEIFLRSLQVWHSTSRRKELFRSGTSSAETLQ